MQAWRILRPINRSNHIQNPKDSFVQMAAGSYHFGRPELFRGHGSPTKRAVGENAASDLSTRSNGVAPCKRSGTGHGWLDI